MEATPDTLIPRKSYHAALDYLRYSVKVPNGVSPMRLGGAIMVVDEGLLMGKELGGKWTKSAIELGSAIAVHPKWDIAARPLLQHPPIAARVLHHYGRDPALVPEAYVFSEILRSAGAEILLDKDPAGLYAAAERICRENLKQPNLLGHLFTEVSDHGLDHLQTKYAVNIPEETINPLPNMETFVRVPRTKPEERFSLISDSPNYIGRNYNHVLQNGTDSVKLDALRTVANGAHSGEFPHRTVGRYVQEFSRSLSDPAMSASKKDQLGTMITKILLSPVSDGEIWTARALQNPNVATSFHKTVSQNNESWLLSDLMGRRLAEGTLKAFSEMPLKEHPELAQTVINAAGLSRQFYGQAREMLTHRDGQAVLLNGLMGADGQILENHLHSDNATRWTELASHSPKLAAGALVAFHRSHMKSDAHWSRRTTSVDDRVLLDLTTQASKDPRYFPLKLAKTISDVAEIRNKDSHADPVWQHLGPLCSSLVAYRTTDDARHLASLNTSISSLRTVSPELASMLYAHAPVED